MKPNQQSELIRQLRNTSGHLTATIEMVEVGQPCEQTLHHLNAVKAELHQVGIRLIICQSQTSQAIIINSSSPQQRIAELEQLQSLYMVFIQYSNHHSEVSND